MTDAASIPVVLGGLVVAHIWQSVALAAVLAAALIFGRRLSGANRYSLAAAAFLACLALPAASFFPGEGLVRAALTWTQAPITIVEPDSMAREQPSETGLALAATDSSAAAPVLGLVRMGTDIARDAIENSTPASADAGIALWALDAGVRAAEAGLGASPLAVESAGVVSPAPKPMFTLPKIDLPQLPDLTLPLLLVWLAGVVVMLARTGRDLIAVERLVARAQTIDLPPSLKQRMKGVRVAISADAPGPMAAGLFRPCVVLPDSATAQLNSPGMAALLEHERAHIERRDMAVALAQRVVLALLWWSPALHWISRRIDEERELACDETAVERTGDARAFARSLTTQAENQLWARAPRLAVGAIGPRSQFGRRIRRLIDLAKSGGAPSKYSGRLAFSGLALAAVLAAVVTPRIIAQSPESPPSQQESEDAIAPLAGEGRGWRLARFSPQEPPPAPPAPPSPFSPLSPVAPLAPMPPLPPEFEAEMDALGVELDLLMQEVARELEGVALEMQPALDAELAGLGAELAGLGAEIAATVAAELAMEMPGVMEEVRLALADVDWNEHADEVRDALNEARAEIHAEFGPEFREELRRSLEEAREEMAAHREEIAGALAEKRAGMAEAREALALARAELAESRARGDFDHDRAEIARELADADRGVVATRRLTAAAAKGDLAEIRRLLADGVDPDRHVTGHGTPLGAAARSGELAAVRVLVEAGADVNRVYATARGERTALAEAIEQDETAIANYLRGRGAIAEPQDSN